MTTRSSSGSTPGNSSPATTLPTARWEWRSFEYQPELWQHALGEHPVAVQASLSRETYLLVPDARINVKIRNDRLEVKQLLASDPAGIQQWSPTLQAELPLASSELAALLRIWQCEPAGEFPRRLPARELMRWLLGRVPSLQVIPLKKWRRRYEVDGCRAERATIHARGAILESLAFEHEDPAVLLATLNSRGLDPACNTSYPLALCRLIGWDPQLPSTTPSTGS